MAVSLVKASDVVRRTDVFVNCHVLTRRSVRELADGSVVVVNFRRFPTIQGEMVTTDTLWSSYSNAVTEVIEFEIRTGYFSHCFLDH